MKQNSNKNKINIIYLIITFIIASTYLYIEQKAISLNENELIVHFTPEDNTKIPSTTLNIVNNIKNAKNEILVQTYTFTSKSITEALIKQHKKGIKIIIIADNSQINSIVLTKLKNEGVPIFIDKLPGIAHNKVMIIDDSIVLTGSFNFTESAQYRNAENSLTIKNKKIAQKYKDNFNKRLNKSKDFNNIKPIYKEEKEKPKKKKLR